MADIKSVEKRSLNMAAIQSKNTRPEIYIRKKLFALGYRYRLNSKKIFGHPDIYLAKYKAAIFIHGCFWHRHNECKYAYIPKSRVEFWQSKFESNIQRDKLVRQRLEEADTRVLVVWECIIKQSQGKKRLEEELFSLIEGFLHSDTDYKELDINNLQ